MTMRAEGDGAGWVMATGTVAPPSGTSPPLAHPWVPTFAGMTIRGGNDGGGGGGTVEGLGCVGLDGYVLGGLGVGKECLGAVDRAF